MWHHWFFVHWSSFRSYTAFFILLLFFFMLVSGDTTKEELWFLSFVIRPSNCLVYASPSLGKRKLAKQSGRLGHRFVWSRIKSPREEGREGLNRGRYKVKSEVQITGSVLISLNHQETSSSVNIPSLLNLCGNGARKGWWSRVGIARKGTRWTGEGATGSATEEQTLYRMGS